MITEDRTMFKMIIADDEPATRQGIRTAINWPMLDIEIIGEAANGTEALEMVRALDPDILICDIRMPKMDGITLAGILHSEKPDLQILFLSGYSDKEYLKTAIRINAVDYLYKPFELDELISAVKKAKSQINKKNVLLKPAGDSDIALQLIDSQGRAAIIESGRLPLDSRGPLQTIVIRIKADSGVLQATDPGNQDLPDISFLAHRYHDALRKAAALIWGASFVMSLAGNGYIIHANRQAGRRAPDSKSRLRRLLAAFEPITDRVAIGVSNPVERLSDLKESFIEARKAASAAFLVGYGKIITYAEVSDQPFAAQPDFENQLINTMVQGNAAAATSLVKDYVRHMKSCTPDDVPKIKDVLIQIALQISSRLQKHAGAKNNFVTDIILSTSEIGEINAYLIGLIEKYQEESSRLSSMGRIVYDAERFILSHIEDADLSIKVIAEHVYVTPTYLCYIYKKKTGRTINHFIMDARMKKAQELVVETNLQLGEIATRLGYANQNYFTKTFTKYFGVNPSTWRNKTL
jgi:two-component system response regulator YesN